MKRPLRPEDLLDWKWAGSLALSPDGERAAWVEIASDRSSNRNQGSLWIAPVDGSEPPRRLATGEASSPRWSPDGRLLAFVSARESDWRGDLQVLDMERGGEARTAVRLPRGVAEFAWRPDSRGFALTGRPEYPEQRWTPGASAGARRTAYAERELRPGRMHYRRDGAGAIDDEPLWLWTAELDGDDAPRAVLTDGYPIANLAWTPDGRIAFTSARTPDHELTWHSQVWALAPEGGQPESLTDAPGAVQGFAFTESGGVACVAYPQPGFPLGCRQSRLFVDGRDLTGEVGLAVGQHVLAEGIDPVAWGSDPVVAAGATWFRVTERGASHLWRAGAGGELERVLGGDRVVGSFSIAGDRIVFAQSSPTDPASIRVAALDGSGERVLHDPNPWLADIDAGEMRELEVSEGAGQAWVLVPPGHDTARPGPAVLMIHGGPHHSYGWSWNYQMRPLCAAGYTVIFGNPPGSTGYGEEFSLRTHRAWGEADMPALMEYCDAAVKAGYAEEDRLGVTGGSYGGYLTLWLVTHTDRFKAALAARGVSNLESIYGSAEFGWSLVAGCMECEPWQDPELYRRLSPVHHLENVTTPLRLVGCINDMRVPIEQVEQVYVRLKVMGRDVDLVMYREGHGLILGGKPWARVEHTEAIIDWFRERLPLESPAPAAAAR